MKRKLPPLHALRVFEAAGRHLSFTHAASELHLTQGAVSRQVRLLEEYCGKDLFVRMTRKVELTQDGRTLMQSAERAFTDIEQGLERLNVETQHKTLTLAILPTLASFWLMPRLSNFSQAHKGIDVRIFTSIEPAPFSRGTIDIAIACGPLPGKRYQRLQPRVDLEMTDDWKGVHAHELFPDKLVPVLSKRLAAQIGPLNNIADLRKHRLIHTVTRAKAWPDWLRAHHVDWHSSPDDIDFGHFFMTLQAAQEDRGIAIVPTVLLTQYVGRADLVVPFAPTVASAAEYYLLTNEKSEEDTHVQLFRQWLIAEAQQIAQAL